MSNSCNSICGDQILAIDEVCDADNELRYNGCYQCKYQCQIECLDCQFRKYIQRDTSFVLGKQKEICEGLIRLQLYQ